MAKLLQQLRSIGTPHLFRKHSSVFLQGEVPRYALFMLDGVVKAYTISRDGTKTIVHLFGPGSVLPAGWVNNQSPAALFNYDAHGDVRTLRFQKTDLHQILATDAECAKEYLDNIARAQAALLLRANGLAQSRATDKICYTLYYLVFRHGIEKTPGNYELNLRLTQGMLAELIGQTRESTAKRLKNLQQAGVVTYRSSTYVVNKKKLEDYIGEDSFRDMQH